MQQFDKLIERCSNIHRLAEGGQKVVMTAIHPEYGQVVIKYGNYGRTTGLERIDREVALLKEIDSPYYPKQFEFLIDATTKQFLIIEEHLNATELEKQKAQFADDESVLELLQNLVRALSILWNRNVVHRDLKPGNILIDPDGIPKIIDLGIARFLDKDSITASFALHGPATPLYASPDQLLNKKTMISIRTDFFLLAIVVLELIHGFHPFDPVYVGNSASIVENIQNGYYVPPNENCDARLRGYIQRALQPKPFQRFRSVKQVIDQLGMEL